MQNHINKFIEQIKIPQFNRSIEKEYSEHYNKQSIFYLRLALTIFLISLLPFGLLDYLSSPEHYLLFWKLRIFIIVPASVIPFYLSYRPMIVGNYQKIATISNFAINICMLAILFYSEKNGFVYKHYFKGITLVMTLTIIMRIRFLYAVINYFTIGILYVLLAIFVQKMLETPQMTSVFYTNLVFMLTTIFALTIAHLILEIYSKSVFINQKTINYQKDRIEEKNSEISFQKEEIMKQKKGLEKRHREIIASIHYAKSIQKAILPSNSSFEELFEQYLIVYKPKEDVSGDFYYLKKINEFTIIAVADCTGHGVPGGFLTMISYTFIDEILKNTQIKTTSATLEVLRERIKKVFFDTKNQDGLDVSLCAINNETGIMQFSAAYQSIYITNNKNGKEYKGTKNPIGFYPYEKKFRTENIELSKDDRIFLYSDGIIDQRSKTRKKFGKKRFFSIFDRNINFPVSDIKDELHENIQLWTENFKQFDDITVVAIKPGISSEEKKTV